MPGLTQIIHSAKWKYWYLMQGSDAKHRWKTCDFFSSNLSLINALNPLMEKYAHIIPGSTQVYFLIAH